MFSTGCSPASAAKPRRTISRRFWRRPSKPPSGGFLSHLQQLARTALDPLQLPAGSEDVAPAGLADETRHRPPENLLEGVDPVRVWCFVGNAWPGIERD